MGVWVKMAGVSGAGRWYGLRNSSGAFDRLQQPVAVSSGGGQRRSAGVLGR